ncbi:MAG TPA: autotransporter outer membrane beta-barrel domain-containing protein [Thiolapillus brandeum]|uniref:Autotransporter outer membrane beta-barrel domain-containing protein n=1 Tax=Thiolapillus brandeum TaxID=1076588 RepID=A0A831K2P4_9GAMM|nr:autotransporter outer membrane beta-barrel domain-containing protein [Thiolapillus brandeum]
MAIKGAILLPQVAQAATQVIFNDPITADASLALGINDLGHLNTSVGNVASNASATGLSFRFEDGNFYDATSPGCHCEGWGVAANGVSAWASISNGGINNLTSVSFSSTATSALSISEVTSLAGMQITHDFTPSAEAPGRLFSVTVTIANGTGGLLSDVRYNRTMDWDVPPTEFSEYVTIQGYPATSLLSSHDNGFQTPDPLATPNPMDPATLGVNFTDNGPDDHGAAFNFGFGDLPEGEEITFYIYYGAASSEAEALEALGLVGAEVYSLGQSNTTDGPTLGTPATYIFAFSGVGGTPLGTLNMSFQPLTFHGITMARTVVRQLMHRLTGRLQGGDSMGDVAALQQTLNLIGGMRNEGQFGNFLSQMAQQQSASLGFNGMGGMALPVSGSGGYDLFRMGEIRGFVAGSYNFGDYGAIDGQKGFDYDGYQITFGIDKTFWENSLAGLALSYGQYDSDIEDDGGNFDSEAWLLTAYGAWTPLVDTTVEVAASYGRGNHDIDRTSGTSIYEGDTNSTDTSFALSVHKDIHHQEAVIGPYATIQYTKSKVDGYTEKGGIGTTTVESQSAKSLTAGVGFHASDEYKGNDVAVVPEIRASVEYEFYDSDRAVTVISAGSPSVIDVLGGEKGLYGRIDAALAANWDNGAKSLRFNFGTTVGRDNINDYSVAANFRMALDFK